jgi:hypothetical protein
LACRARPLINDDLVGSLTGNQVQIVTF